MTTHALTSLSISEATQLTPIGTHAGMDITVQNVSDVAYVYLGGESVTTSNYGYRLSPGQAFSLELTGKGFLFAITDTNESKVALLKTNLESGN